MSDSRSLAARILPLAQDAAFLVDADTEKAFCRICYGSVRGLPADHYPECPLRKIIDLCRSEMDATP